MLKRMQVQQEAVARAAENLVHAQERLAKAAEESAAIAEQAKALQTAAAREPDATRRTALENQAKAMEATVEQRRTGDLQLHATESELAGVLRGEQRKLDEIDDRLNALERALDNLPVK